MPGICEKGPKNRVIIISEDIDLRVIYALRYSSTISEDIVVFGTFTKDEDEQNLRSRWSKIKTDIPLVLRYSCDGGIIAPLLDFLHSSEYGIGAEEIVTVVLPRLVVERPWHKLLHNHAGRYIERRLSSQRQIIVETVPVPLEEDGRAL